MFGANKAVNRVSWLRWWASFSAFMITKHTVLANILVQHKSCILCPFMVLMVNFRKTVLRRLLSSAQEFLLSSGNAYFVNVALCVLEIEYMVLVLLSQ